MFCETQKKIYTSFRTGSDVVRTKSSFESHTGLNNTSVSK